jgi:iron uptake system component EfeO
MADVTALKERLRALKLRPDEMTAGAARLVAALAETKIVAGEDHYAQTDLADFAANLEGVAKTMALLRPVAVPAAPGVVAEIEGNMRAADAALAALKGPGGFPPYGSVDAAARQTLSEALRPLAGAIGKFNAAVGLE